MPPRQDSLWNISHLWTWLNNLSVFQICYQSDSKCKNMFSDFFRTFFSITMRSSEPLYEKNNRTSFSYKNNICTFCFRFFSRKFEKQNEFYSSYWKILIIMDVNKLSDYENQVIIFSQQIIIHNMKNFILCLMYEHEDHIIIWLCCIIFNLFSFIYNVTAFCNF